MSSIIKVDQIQTAAGGVPTAADLGLNVSGTVLQVVRHSLTSNIATASTSYVPTGHSVSITPKASNSIILVEFKGGRVWIPNSSNQLDVAIAINGDTSSLTDRRLAAFYQSNSAVHTGVYGSEYFTNVGTSPITYAAYFKSGSGQQLSINDAYTSFQQSLVVTEIAG